MLNPIIWLKEIDWRANSYICGNILFDASQPVSVVDPYKDQIDTIIITHGHYDHIANIQNLVELCDAKVYIGEYDYDFLSKRELSLSDHFNGRLQDISASILHDGDQIGEYKVIHTPGHTRGSICLYRDIDGALITGDTIFPGGSFGRTDLPTGNNSDLMHSIDKLATLHINSIWCGHEPPVPSDAMRHILLSQSEIHKYG